ncbi:hypothetical protein NLJ89_g11239 [Agrocybe chaxingu]|uniref:Uncharacterized protein n=1 Tax=Agrocybe chaxingu TaxID=84603 RepID=A0A9W8JQC7_9AGAR|nr:hypothetical protein NLJ89_g11239 [Agrocybe chaxingu]
MDNSNTRSPSSSGEGVQTASNSDILAQGSPIGSDILRNQGANSPASSILIRGTASPSGSFDSGILAGGNAPSGDIEMGWVSPSVGSNVADQSDVEMSSAILAGKNSPLDDPDAKMSRVSSPTGSEDSGILRRVSSPTGSEDSGILGQGALSSGSDTGRGDPQLTSGEALRARLKAEMAEFRSSYPEEAPSMLFVEQAQEQIHGLIPPMEYVPAGLMLLRSRTATLPGQIVAYNSILEVNTRLEDCITQLEKDLEGIRKDQKAVGEQEQDEEAEDM